MQITDTQYSTINYEFEVDATHTLSLTLQGEAGKFIVALTEHEDEMAHPVTVTLAVADTYAKARAFAIGFLELHEDSTTDAFASL